MPKAKPKRPPKSRAKPGAVMGRPTKYKPEYCDEVISLMAQGLCISEVCAKWGIAYETFRDWREKNADFSVACKKGLEQLRAWYCELFKAHATGRVSLVDVGEGKDAVLVPSLGKGANIAAAIFLSKNVAGFKDTVDATIEHSGSVEHKHEVAMATLSTEQLKAMQAIMLKGDNKEG